MSIDEKPDQTHDVWSRWISSARPSGLVRRLTFAAVRRKSAGLLLLFVVSSVDRSMSCVKLAAASSLPACAHMTAELMMK